MQPTDNNTPAPQPPKQGFFARLFGKKPEPTPVVPPTQSLTPEPQLTEPTEAAVLTAQPSVSVAAQPNVDSITGAPQTDAVSSPDANGDITSLALDVPANLSAAEASQNTGGENPTLAVQPPAAAPVVPPVTPSNPVATAPVTPVAPVVPTPQAPTQTPPTPPITPSQPQ